MVNYLVPKHEDSVSDFTISSDFVGAEGTGRTYTVANAGLVDAGLIIVVDGSILGPNDFSRSTDTLTFNVYIANDSVMSIDYHVSASVSSINTVSTTLEVIRTAGIGVEIFNENVGTGNNSEADFSLDNGNVIALSYVLKYGAAGSNDLTELVETTHYTIDKDGGDILLTAAGITALGTNVLYADYVHSPKISDSGIQHMITRAEDEVELMTGNYWGSVKSTTEVLDGRETGRYPTTDFPYVDTDPDEEDTLQLKYKGVQSITSVKFLATGTSGDDMTLSSSSYSFNERGLLVLHTNTLPVGRLNVEVVYTHGYSSPPTYIKQLVELISSLMIFTGITGGSYDDATVFSLGRKSISIGEVYVNVREVVKQLSERIKPLMNKIGSDLVVC